MVNSIPKRCPHCGTTSKRRFGVKIYTNGDLQDFEAYCNCGYKRKLPGKEYD